MAADFIRHEQCRSIGPSSASRPEPPLSAAGRRWAVGLFSGCSGTTLRGAVPKWLWVITLAGASLILASSAGVSAQQLSQTPTGSLSGKLTDLNSRPVDGALLVLRNAATGTESKTTTSRSG